MAEQESEEAAAQGMAPGPESFQITPADHADMKEGKKPYVPGEEPVKPPEDKEGKYGAMPEGAKLDEEKPAEEEPETPEEGEEKSAEKPDDAPSEFDTEVGSWTQEFTESGELKADTIKEIYSKVFHADLSDEYKATFLGLVTAGITAQNQVATLAGWDMVGGQDSWNKMSAWAESNLTKEEIGTFNASTASTSKDVSDAAIKGLSARYQMATGIEPDNEPDLTHSASSAAGTPEIGSRQELSRLMATREYDKDPAFRAKVNAQLERSMNSDSYRRH